MTTSEKKEKKNKKKTRILIVDDDPIILELLGISISSFGYEYSAAEDGLAALEKLKHEKFSLVITDMMMPNMDGMQLLQHIHEKYPNLGVIVVTGYTGTFSYTDVIKAGASDFISKPFNTDELEAKINRILREQKLITELKHLSRSDPLTNLYNRRFYDSKLKEETYRANRQKYPLFLGVIDVDKFKPYNDTKGHQAGDNILKTVSKILKDCTRDNVDWIFRIGGDEFVVITPQLTRDQAARVGQRILQSYNQYNFSPTTLSVGFAQFSRNPANKWSQDIKDFVSKADKAMYQAKAAGGNKVEFAPQQQAVPDENEES